MGRLLDEIRESRGETARHYHSGSVRDHGRRRWRNDQREILGVPPARARGGQRKDERPRRSRRAGNLSRREIDRQSRWQTQGIERAGGFAGRNSERKGPAEHNVLRQLSRDDRRRHVVIRNRRPDRVGRRQEHLAIIPGRGAVERKAGREKCRLPPSSAIVRDCQTGEMARPTIETSVQVNHFAPLLIARGPLDAVEGHERIDPEFPLGIEDPPRRQATELLCHEPGEAVRRRENPIAREHPKFSSSRQDIPNQRTAGQALGRPHSPTGRHGELARRAERKNGHPHTSGTNSYHRSTAGSSQSSYFYRRSAKRECRRLPRTSHRRESPRAPEESRSAPTSAHSQTETQSCRDRTPRRCSAHIAPPPGRRRQTYWAVG